MQQPLVSVFLPTYNQQEFIAESIESVLNQDYDNLEIVIGDDASTDNTWQIVQNYQINHPNKIKAFSNPKNLGITGNCNEVLKRCTGKYIAFFSGDDVFLPGKISKQIAIMERDPNIVLSYHDVEVFDSTSGKTLSYWSNGSKSNLPIAGNVETVLQAVIETVNSAMAGMSVVVRSNSIPVAGYNQCIPIASDWLMWIEILANSEENNKVEYLPAILVKYRKHDSNITCNPFNCLNDSLVTLAIVESKYPFLFLSITKAYAKIRYNLGIVLISANNLKIGRKCLFLSLFSSWVSWKIFYWIAASYMPILLRLRTKK